MSENGQFETGLPEEGTGNVSESAREQAREQFAAAQAAMQQLQREERKARKRDDNVAQVILQFLTDAQRTHLATLIARLVSRNCPSTFLLALLSLISDACRLVVEEYLKEQHVDLSSVASGSSILPAQRILTDEANAHLALWIVRTEYAMRLDEEQILTALLIDDQNVDGTVLQLTTFILQEFLADQKINVPFAQLQLLSTGILQALFHPALQARGHREPNERDGSEEG